MKKVSISELITISDYELLKIIDYNLEYLIPTVLLGYAEIKRRDLLLSEELLNKLKIFSERLNVDNLEDEVLKIVKNHGSNSYEELYMSIMNLVMNIPIKQIENSNNRKDILKESPELELLKKSESFVAVVHLANGDKNYFNKEKIIDGIQSNIINGKYSRNDEVTTHIKTEEELWQIENFTIESLLKDIGKYNIIYRPIWHFALKGLYWGSIIGVILKLTDTFILFAHINKGMAFLLVLMTIAPIVSFIIPSNKWVPFAIVFFFIVKTGEISVMGAFFAASLIGAILGCLPGMAIGGLIGLKKHNKLSLAKDANPEPKHYKYTLIVLPFFAGIGLILAYFFIFNPWLEEILQ